MAFNSNTYHANKSRRRAFEALASARQQAPWSSVTPAEWRKSRVRLARAYWRSYLSYRSMQRMNADMKKVHRREMTPADFIAKWELKK